MFDTLLYQLNDALSRLVNVRKYENSKDGEEVCERGLKVIVPFTPLSPLLYSSPPPLAGEWSSLGGQERKEKELFLASEQRASRGFMTQVSYSIECSSHSFSFSPPLPIHLLPLSSPTPTLYPLSLLHISPSLPLPVLPALPPLLLLLLPPPSPPRQTCSWSCYR